MTEYLTWPARLAVIGVVVPLGLLSRAPSADPAELDALAGRFRFAETTLQRPPVPDGGVVYTVNPSAPQLRTYFHSIGASVALGDVDGDGLANDLCTSDIRTKSMVVAPVPGTGDRFPPFELDLDLPVGRAEIWPGACRLVDLNEDGLTDVLLSSMSSLPSVFLRRDQGPDALPGPDAYRRQALIEGDELAYIPTMNVVDVDGDGHLDVILGAYLPDGVPYFDADATDPVVMQDGFGRARNGGRNRLVVWTGATSGPEPTVSFLEVDDPFPGDSERGWTLAIASGDLDRDGLSDLYVANDFGKDSLLHNRSRPGNVRLVELLGDEDWRLPASKVVGNDSFKGMGADLADLNGDGLLDIYVSNIGSDFGLHEGHFLWMSTGDLGQMGRGVAPYRDEGEALGVSHSAWSWDARMDDFDNDGVLELIQATGFFKGTVNKWADLSQLAGANDQIVKYAAFWPEFPAESDIDGWDPEPFFVRTADGRYADLSARVLPGVLANARTMVTADVDGDGDLDLAIGNHWEDSLFFRNEAPSPGRSLGLHLLLPLGGDPTATSTHPGHPTYREGTPAVGAFVTVKRADGRELVRQVDLSNGHTGARSPDLLFGLGDDDRPVEATVRWRDRRGALHDESLSLSPGWHTVILGGAR